MSALPFAFAYPPILLALIALPLVWLLLRVTPPKPKAESFPPTRLLLEITQKEEQPARTPWWLILLRCLIAAALIIALAGPIFKPTTEQAPGAGPLLLVVDNGWASAPRWNAMTETAHRVIRLAEQAGRPITLLATADGPTQELAPGSADDATQRLESLAPRPYGSDYDKLMPAVDAAVGATHFGGLVWLSDGLGGDSTTAFARDLSDRIDGPAVVYADTTTGVTAIKPPIGGPDALTVPVIRDETGLPAGGFVRATDLKGRAIGDFRFDFANDKAETEARIDLPVELRNDIARLDVVGADTAGAVQLLDDRWRRRRIGLLSGAAADAAQPLLSPLYYISRAVQPFADVSEPREANAAVAVPELIDGGASVIAMADIGTLPTDVEEKLAKWVDDGGTLVRFAGPHLATATDSLIPVRLRHGDRVLGGSMTWQEEQPLASFSDKSPFAGMTVPDDVLVKRQVLAEPDGALADRTWAALADGTPLVTAKQSGRGWLILFHVTADTSWSNLPLSGTFVDMLRRIIAFSSAARTHATSPEQGQAAATIAPFRLLDGYGHFTAPGPEAQPIPANADTVTPDAEHPPGLYGTEEGFRSVNLLDENAKLTPFDPAMAPEATVQAYPTEAPTDLRPWLLAAGLALFLVDALAVLWLNGALSLGRRRPATAAVLAAGIVVAGALLATGALADEAERPVRRRRGEQDPARLCDHRQSEIDAASKAGLYGLSHVLTERTALEPGDPSASIPAVTSWLSSRFSTGRSILIVRCRRLRRWPASTPICARAARCSSIRATSSSDRPISTPSPARRRSSVCARCSPPSTFPRSSRCRPIMC